MTEEEKDVDEQRVYDGYLAMYADYYAIANSIENPEWQMNLEVGDKTVNNSFQRGKTIVIIILVVVVIIAIIVLLVYSGAGPVAGQALGSTATIVGKSLGSAASTAGKLGGKLATIAAKQGKKMIVDGLNSEMNRLVTGGNTYE